ncbi:MAG: hypothetical protein KQA41_00380 [Candidatus Aenigmarchaeota archaeon]|nr:hypothetical protein [Candidatus Aenigmarchaeota archaeon]MBU5688673.1 hypothetical protein [Candidatus Aenigmarchaeota archaeon]
MKKIIIIIAFFLLIQTVYSQELVVNQIGFGKSYKEIIVSIANNGTKTFDGIEIYIDDKFYERINILLLPNNSINYIILTEPGEHMINIKTGNLNSTIKVINNEPENIQVKEQIQKKDYTKIYAIILVVLITATILYILFRKPKL